MALLSPILAGPHRLARGKNRLVMAPMVRNYADSEGGHPEVPRAHGRIARGGVGTMILEATNVTPEGKACQSDRHLLG